MENLFYVTYFILLKAFTVKYSISPVLNKKSISLLIFHIFLVCASMDISCLLILSDLNDSTPNVGSAHICLKFSFPLNIYTKLLFWIL